MYTSGEMEADKAFTYEWEWSEIIEKMHTGATFKKHVSEWGEECRTRGIDLSSY